MNPRRHNPITNHLALMLGLLLVLTFAGCTAATPSPTPVLPSPTTLPVSPTSLPTNTPAPTDQPRPSPTALPSPTIAPSPTPLPMLGLTLSEALLFSGPDKSLPLVASYTSGITLTVLGSSQDQQWLVIEIPPGQQGWSQAANFHIAVDRASFDVLPTPTGLATLTPAPMAGLRVVVSFDIKHYGGTSYSYTTVNIFTGQPKQVVNLEILKADGKRIKFERNRMTDNEGWVDLHFDPKSIPNGTYTLILTDTSGNVIQKTFEVLKQ